MFVPCIACLAITDQHYALITQPNNKKIIFFVPWFLGLFLGLLGALIQKNALDRPHQL
jgi:hypothetical protein